jgi:hypothetical protein
VYFLLEAPYDIYSFQLLAEDQNEPKRICFQAGRVVVDSLL